MVGAAAPVVGPGHGPTVEIECLGPGPEPTAAAEQLLGLRGLTLLEDAREGGWSYLAAEPIATLEVRGGRVLMDDATEEGRQAVADDQQRSVMAHGVDPVQALREFSLKWGLDPGSAGPAPEGGPPEFAAERPPFTGGAIGFVGYEFGRLLMGMSSRRVAGGTRGASRPPVPDVRLAVYPTVLAHRAGGWFRCGPRTDWAQAALEERDRRGQEGCGTGAPKEHGSRTLEVDGGTTLEPLRPKGPVTTSLSADEYRGAVTRILDYIAAGDCYQVNLTQQIEVEVEGNPFAYYCRLRSGEPVPYGAYIAGPNSIAGAASSECRESMGDVAWAGPPAWAVAAASPECFLSLRGRDLVTRPIKGTRPRHADPEADAHAAADLVASAKDRAENVMVVDLERNDLGKVCETGSVAVAELCALESFPTVWHLTSTVTGRLREEVGLAEVLAATFPGGSITGAPKLRAMEIIEELEPVARGLYTGCYGWVGFGGDLEMAMAIRTPVIADGVLSLGAGGGVVADSDPEAERLEAWEKAAGALRALGLEGTER
ncbi:MAG: anthranilate synthase component I family protein [Actinomycetota bacterium]